MDTLFFLFFSLFFCFSHFFFFFVFFFEGPDGPGNEIEFIAFQSDQDAYAFSGQKCSAQSMMFVHDAWETPEVDIIGRVRTLASKRSLENLTSCPVLTWTTAQFMVKKFFKPTLPDSNFLLFDRPLTHKSFFNNRLISPFDRPLTQLFLFFQ